MEPVQFTRRPIHVFIKQLYCRSDCQNCSLYSLLWQPAEKLLQFNFWKVYCVAVDLAFPEDLSFLMTLGKSLWLKRAVSFYIWSSVDGDGQILTPQELSENPCSESQNPDLTLQSGSGGSPYIWNRSTLLPTHSQLGTWWLTSIWWLDCLGTVAWHLQSILFVKSSNREYPLVSREGFQLVSSKDRMSHLLIQLITTVISLMNESLPQYDKFSAQHGSLKAPGIS